MTFQAARIQRIQPSPTLATTAKAQELKAQGKTIIPLSAGEPDFDTPDFIKAAAKKAMDEGQTKYTPAGGTPALKSAIIAKLERDNGLRYEASQVVVTNGGKQAIFNAFMATVDTGDEVIIPAPYWVSYPDIVNLCGGKPVMVDCPQEQDFKLTPEALAQAITPDTKWLILNSPSNPTGSTYTKDELLALGEILKQHPHVHIMSDDIYEHLVYEGHAFYTLPSIMPELSSRVLIINGVSKAYSMTGWRIGYAAGDVDLIKAMTKLQSQSTSNACSIAQAAAVEALQGDQSFLKDWVATFQARRDLIVAGLNDIPGLKSLVPGGAFYAFVNCEGVIGKKTPDGKVIETDMDFATYLLESAGVAVVGGTAFGLSPYFRASYALGEDDIKQACALIKEAVLGLVG